MERSDGKQSERDLDSSAVGLLALKESLLPIFERGIVNARARYNSELEIQVSEVALMVSARRGEGGDDSLYSVSIFGNPPRLTIEFKCQHHEAAEAEIFRYVEYLDNFLKTGPAFVLSWLVRASREGAGLPPRAEGGLHGRGIILGFVTFLSLFPLYGALATQGLWPDGALGPAIGLFCAFGLFVYLRSTKNERLRRDLTKDVS